MGSSPLPASRPVLTLLIRGPFEIRKGPWAGPQGAGWSQEVHGGARGTGYCILFTAVEGVTYVLQAQAKKRRPQASKNISREHIKGDGTRDSSALRERCMT